MLNPVLTHINISHDTCMLSSSKRRDRSGWGYFGFVRGKINLLHLIYSIIADLLKENILLWNEQSRTFVVFISDSTECLILLKVLYKWVLFVWVDHFRKLNGCFEAQPQWLMQLAATTDDGNGICLACTSPATRLTLTIIQSKIWDQKKKKANEDSYWRLKGCYPIPFTDPAQCNPLRHKIIFRFPVLTLGSCW